jgi:hypothetical protein
VANQKYNNNNSLQLQAGQLIKNRHEEVEENSFKNNIYQFHGRNPKNRLQKSSEVTPIHLLSNFM